MVTWSYHGWYSFVDVFTETTAEVREVFLRARVWGRGEGELLPAGTTGGEPYR